MKLVMVLMLTALPLYCYAGIGCTIYEDAINEVIDSNVTETQYVKDFEQFIPDEATKDAVMNMKQCFLDQTQETLENDRTMLEAIINSFWCANY